MVVHVTILSARGKGVAIRGEVDSMHRSEMAVDLCKFLVENYTEETDFEATGSLVCHGYISRVLASCQEDVELLELL